MTEYTATPQTGSGRPRRRKALVIAGIALLVLFGASFAANIAINNGTEVEFGQGIEQIIACDADGIAKGNPGVTVTLISSDPGFVTVEPTQSGSPGASFSATATPSTAFQFSVEGLVVSDIDEECKGKILTVGLYTTNGDLVDDVVFELDSTVLGTGPYRAGAFAGGTESGCATVSSGAFPDGSDVIGAQDCFPSDADPANGLDGGIDASVVAYVALETSDPAV